MRSVCPLGRPLRPIISSNDERPDNKDDAGAGSRVALEEISGPDWLGLLYDLAEEALLCIRRLKDDIFGG
jgi:hypothetical protein